MRQDKAVADFLELHMLKLYTVNEVSYADWNYRR